MLKSTQADRLDISKLRDQESQGLDGDEGQGGVRRSVSPE